MSRNDVEEIAGFHFYSPAIVHGRGCAPGKNQADVFHGATLHALRGSDVDGPFPSRLIARAANRHFADAYEFEFPFFKCADFVRMIEALENDFVHDGSFYEFDSAAKQKAASFLAALNFRAKTRPQKRRVDAAINGRSSTGLNLPSSSTAVSATVSASASVAPTAASASPASA